MSLATVLGLLTCFMNTLVIITELRTLNSKLRTQTMTYLTHSENLNKLYNKVNSFTWYRQQTTTKTIYLSLAKRSNSLNCIVLYCIVLYCIYYTDMVIYYKIQCLKIYILSNPAHRDLSVSLN